MERSSLCKMPDSVSGGQDSDGQFNMSNVSCKKEEEKEHLVENSSIKRKPERKKQFYPDAFDFRQRGVFACLVCFRRFASCLKVKKHFIQEHPTAFCALGHENVTEPRIQVKLLLFCRKNCQYVTSKIDAFTHHLATCVEPDIGSQDCAGNQMDFMREDEDEDDSEDMQAENSHILISKTDQRTRVTGQGKGPEIYPDEELKEIHTCIRGTSKYSASQFPKSHMKLYHSDKSPKIMSSHHEFSCLNQRQKYRNVNAAPERSRWQANVNEKESSPDDYRPVFSRNDSINKTFRQGGLPKHSSRLPIRLYVPSTSSSRSSTHLYNDCKQVHALNKLTCRKCNMNFNKTQDFSVHMEMHEKEKQPNPAAHGNSMDVEEQLTSPSRNLISGGNKIFSPNSQDLVLDRTPIYECVKCKLCFRERRALHRHNRCHSLKVHQCHECGKAFKRSHDLRVHMRTHTGERPYKCDICGAAFCTSSSLHSHLKRHSGEKAYRCTICGKSFLKRFTLKLHLRTHTGERPYQCSVCGKSFSQSGSLNIHMKIHTGEKPFKCEYCGKAFMLSILVKKHTMKVHIKEKAHKCSECGREFGNKACFSWHLKSHQKKTPRVR